MIERNLEKVLEINKDMYKDMKNMADFYVMTGVINEHYLPKINVEYIGMNHDDCMELRDIMFKNNYRKGKFKHYKKEYLERCIGWEWLCYSPFNNHRVDIPHGVLYLYEGWGKGDKTNK